MQWFPLLSPLLLQWFCRFFISFPMFSLPFPWFAMVFIVFSMILLWSSLIFNDFAMVFTALSSVSNGFPCFGASPGRALGGLGGRRGVFSGTAAFTFAQALRTLCASPCAVYFLYLIFFVRYSIYIYIYIYMCVRVGSRSATPYSRNHISYCTAVLVPGLA